MTAQLLLVLLPLFSGLIAVLANVLVNLLRTASARIDQAPKPVKVVLALVIAAAAAALERVVPGVSIPRELTGWDATTAQAVLGAVLSMLLHQVADAKGALRAARALPAEDAA